jgi:hypothetical protein
MLTLVPPAHPDAIIVNSSGASHPIFVHSLLASMLSCPCCWSLMLALRPPVWHCCILHYHCPTPRHHCHWYLFLWAVLLGGIIFPPPLCHQCSCHRCYHCHCHLCWRVIFVDTMSLSHSSMLSHHHRAAAIAIVIFMVVVLTPWPLWRTRSSAAPTLLPSQHGGTPSSVCPGPYSQSWARGCPCPRWCRCWTPL